MRGRSLCRLPAADRLPLFGEFDAVTLAKMLRSERLTGWHVAAALGLAALGVLSTLEAWRDIHRIAYLDEEYSHIFIVPVVAVWMVWVRRMRFRHCKISGTAFGPVCVALGWLASGYGYDHGYDSLRHGGAVLVLVGCLLAVLGKNVLFRFLPAFAVLVFLIPVPGMIRQQIALPLQTWTAQIAQICLEVLGVETEVSGNVLSINGVPVTIADACNGMRMVFPLILVSYAFSFGLPLRNSVRFTVLLFSPVAAIACNVIRTVPTIWLYGRVSDFAEQAAREQAQRLANAFHDLSGWIMLPIAFVLLLGIIKLLRWAMLPVTRYPLASQYA